MALRVRELIDILHQLAPFDLAETWDNVGLLAGEPETEVSHILVALDPVLFLLAEAKRLEANVIITHHPLIFHPLKQVLTDDPAGKFLTLALSSHIQIIGCHTNLDAVREGVSDVLAHGLELENIRPLVPASGQQEECCGLGRIGQLAQPTPPAECIRRLRQLCDPPWLLEAGTRPKRVRTVAVCGGSCSEFAQNARNQGAELFITAEIKHATARWAEEAGLWMIDAGHFASEQPIIEPFAHRLRQRLREENFDNQVHAVALSPPLRILTD